MKKFIFLLILILIASGTAFYFGWIRLPENTQAVAYSSITGYDNRIIKSGSFNWRWQKIIPKTFKIYIFDDSVHTTSVVSEGELPSGKVYSSILAGNPDFAYRISFAVKYVIDSSLLPSLLETGEIEDSLSKWYKEKDREIENTGKNFITSMQNASSSLTNSSELEKKLGDYLLENLTGINFSSITLNNFNIPDMDLYSEAKRQYLNIIKNRENLVLESQTKAASQNADLERQLELLEKYGKLLTKYPILLEYIKANPEMDILKINTGALQE